MEESEGQEGVIGYLRSPHPGHEVEAGIVGHRTRYLQVVVQVECTNGWIRTDEAVQDSDDLGDSGGSESGGPAPAMCSLRMHRRVRLRRYQRLALGMTHGEKTRRRVSVDRQYGDGRELDHRRFVN